MDATDLVTVARSRRGGKIVSLRDADGTEWLTQARLGSGPALGASFAEAELAGWDECAPTVTGCTIDGAIIPDHGDAWDAIWAGSGRRWRHIGTSLPYQLERTIAPTADGGLRLSYRATTDAARVPFLWVAHPQFQAPPGTRVEFPHPPRRVVDVLTAGWPSRAWTARLGSIDDVAVGGCRKLYVHPDETTTTVDLVRPDGNRLRLTLAPTIRYLGLWFDQGAVAPGPAIAIEPALGFADSLAVAVDRGTAPILTPTAPLEWWLELHRPPAAASAEVTTG